MEGIIKVKAQVSRVLFPKSPKVLCEEEPTGIVSWYVDQVLEGKPIINQQYGTITVKGLYYEGIDDDTIYTLRCKEVEDKKYGKQYQLMRYWEEYDLTQSKNQRAFLKTFLTERQVDEIFKTLENPISVIDAHNKEELVKVKGIGEYIAQVIFNKYEENKDYGNVYMELDGYGLTPKFIQKLINKYGNPQTVVDKVKLDPYGLSYDVDGVGFKTADDIALKVGVDRKSPRRIAAYINYILNELGEQGDSYTTAGELSSLIYNEFDGRENILEVYYDEEGNKKGTNISTAIQSLIEEGKLVLEEAGAKASRRVYLSKYYNLEKQIANELLRIYHAENKFSYEDWESKIAEVEEKQGWKFTDEQKQGIKRGLESSISIITGGAGTGKSSTLSGVLTGLGCYEDKYTFCQTSLSGRAAAKMTEITGKEGVTTHRLLGFTPGQGFTYNKYNQLTEDNIIVDEISLYGGDLFLSLVESIPSGSKLIMLGDDGQLESIGCMNLAHDMMHSGVIPTTKLTKIHRQAQKSGIITSSLAIRNGEQLFDRKFEGEMTLGELNDMHLDIAEDKEGSRQRVIRHYKEKYNSPLVNKDVMKIQVLSPVIDRGDASVYDINNSIQKFVNPPSKEKGELKTRDRKGNEFVLRSGDKVMCSKNIYSTTNTHGETTPVFNGWMGVLTSVNYAYGTIEVYFPIIEDTVVFSSGDVNSLMLGYCSTVHKYQGSSAPCIIGVIDATTPPKMRTRELVYTLITRAEKDCTLVGENSIIRRAIMTSGVSNKNTFLLEMLKENA